MSSDITEAPSSLVLACDWEPLLPNKHRIKVFGIKCDFADIHLDTKQG